MSKTHSSSFSVDTKLKDYKVQAPNATRYSPNYTTTTQSASKPTFKNSHTDWRATFSKEKERYMTCTSEPALYNTNNSSKDISNK